MLATTGVFETMPFRLVAAALVELAKSILVHMKMQYILSSIKMSGILVNHKNNKEFFWPRSRVNCPVFVFFCLFFSLFHWTWSVCVFLCLFFCLKHSVHICYVLIFLLMLFLFFLKEFKFGQLLSFTIEKLQYQDSW